MSQAETASVSSDETSNADDDDTFTVYECPGLAPPVRLSLSLSLC